MKTSILVGAAAIVTVAAMAAAHPFEYVGVIGDAFVVCDPGTGIGVGGACIPGGHLVPDPAGRVTLSPVDDIVNPTSAFYCQDLNNNNQCGELGIEPSEYYCGSVTFTTVGFGGQFDPNQPVYWYVDGPILGNPLLGACLAISLGTHGFLNHS